MADETTIHFIQRRTQEVTAQIAALEGQLAPLKAELEKLNRIRGIWHEEAAGSPVIVGVLSSAQDALSGKGAASFLLAPSSASLSVKRAAPDQRYAQMTIKELIIQAFLDQFKTGARAQELRDFIPVAYRREIEPASLRSALHRLKNDGVLEFDESMELWILKQERRRMYLLYDHPSRRAAMRELQDDPSNEGGKE